MARHQWTDLKARHFDAAELDQLRARADERVRQLRHARRMRDATFVVMMVVSVVGFLVLALGCTPAQRKDIVWPTVVECAARNVDHVSPTVSRILLTSGENWRDHLADAALSYGAELVLCAVNEAWREWSELTLAGASHPRLWEGRERAGSFIREKEVTVR